MTFPTIGAGAKEWRLTGDQVAAWQALYPQLDVLQQCRMALAWVEVNPKKTAKGMPRFLVNWLNRAVARGDVIRRPATPTYTSWICPHVEHCSNRWQCRDMTVLQRPEKVKAS